MVEFSEDGWISRGENLSEEEIKQRWGKDLDEVKQILENLKGYRLVRSQEEI